MLKDRDYDVTAHIFLILSLTLTQNERGGRLRFARWRWSAKSAVGRGEVKTWNDARATRANVNAPC